MDKKILHEGRLRQLLADELYADKDLTLNGYAGISRRNQKDALLLLKADRKYDAKRKRLRHKC